MRALVFAASLFAAAGTNAAVPESSGYATMPDGARLFWRALGSGSPTVIMIHGGPGSTMNESLPDLANLASGRRLLFYDQRGGGRSGPIPDLSAVTAEQHVRDLEALRAQLDLDRVALFGHSWGAGLAMLYAMAHPERVERIVLVGSLWPRHDSYPAQYHAALRKRLGPSDYARLRELEDSLPDSAHPVSACREFVALFLRGAGTGKAAMRKLRGDPCDADPGVTRTFFARNGVTMRSLGDYDWRSRLGPVQAPTLVVHGARDVAPVESAREWAASLPNARLLLIPGAGHLPYADQPREFHRAVDSFLRGRWPDRARVIPADGK